jgi:formyl-CoA transferase
VDWVKGYDDYLLKPEHYKEIEGPLSEFFRRYTKKELYQKAREERVQLYPVYTSQDILEDEQLKSQDFWQQVDHPEIGAVIVYPGPALKVSNAPLTLRRRAPLIGEHNEEIYLGELGMTREKLARLKHRDII